MRTLSVAALGLLAAASLAARAGSLPEPDLAALEPRVAAQLSELRGLAASVLADPAAAPADRVQAWGEMGRLFHAYELLSAAGTCYERAQALDPEGVEWPYYRGHVAASQGDLEAAVEHFARALELDPASLAPLIHLADAHHATGRLEEARALLERAAALPSPQPVVWARLGELAVAEGRHAEAVELLSAVLDAVPHATRLHHALGLAYRGLGDMERARYHLALRGEIGLAPEDPLMAELATLQVGERVHLLRGRAAFRVGSYADAAAEFRGAVDARPESVRARINLSAALAGLGDVGGATRELERAVALDPGNPTARFNLATLLANAGEHRLAVIHFAAATAVRPEDEEAWLGEAASWIALRDFGRAANRLTVAGGTLPESGRIALGLARLLAAAPEAAIRDGERALDLAQRVFDAQRSADHAVVVSLALSELGRCDAARQWLDGLIAQGEASAAASQVATLRAERTRLGEATPCRP